MSRQLYRQIWHLLRGNRHVPPGWYSVVTRGPIFAPTVHYKQRSWGVPWQDKSRRPSAHSAIWNAPARKRASRVCAFVAAPRQRMDEDIAWTTKPRKPTARVSAWEKPSARTLELSLPWLRIPRQTHDARAPWAMPPRHAAAPAIPWIAPPRRATQRISAFVVQPRKATEDRIHWLAPPRRLRRIYLPWGQAHRVAWSPPESPGIDVPPTPPFVPVYIPPRGDRVDLPLECLWFDDPGDQIAIPFGPFACFASTLHRKRYIVLNTASVVRLPERTPIAVESGTIEFSVDGMYATYSLTLADPAHEAYLMPDSGGRKLVEINLNGWVFTMLCGLPSSARKFPAKSVTVPGFGRAQILDTPLAPARSYTQAADYTAHQLVDNELTFTGFTSDYDAVDWLVPAGVHHYDKLTPMQAIKSVADASGAVVQAHPWDTVIRVRPRYPASPWAWYATSIDKTIPADIIATDSTSLQDRTKPVYNYVLVSGEQVGVSDPIIRNGSAGDIVHDQVVDALITTHPVALERGRNVLSDRGDQAAVQMTIPLGVPADTSLPGLVLPLDFCEVVDTPATWHGLCNVTRIEFKTVVAANGAKTLIVDQTLTLERHFTDAD